MSTDKSFAETSYEWWKKALGENPDRFSTGPKYQSWATRKKEAKKKDEPFDESPPKTLVDLDTEIDNRKVKINKWQKELEDHKNPEKDFRLGRRDMNRIKYLKSQYQESVYKLKELQQKLNETDASGGRISDNRGQHMKGKEIIPKEDFWEASQKLFQENGEKCLSSRDPKYPSGWMKKKLTGETSNSEYFGYRREDEEKNNPIKLKSKKIRQLLGENHDKWKYSK